MTSQARTRQAASRLQTAAEAPAANSGPILGTDASHCRLARSLVKDSAAHCILKLCPLPLDAAEFFRADLRSYAQVTLNGLRPFQERRPDSWRHFGLVLLTPPDARRRGKNMHFVPAAATMIDVCQSKSTGSQSNDRPRIKSKVGLHQFRG